MTPAERLLDLMIEYQAAKESRSHEWGDYSQLYSSGSREPKEIAAEYEATLRELLSH